ncbi:MAG: hypothetical protein JOY82_01105 [Streptosporangiaceae bacterium]|nr:hypothetical protein [Streptosporangiaceae bacterium]
MSDGGTVDDEIGADYSPQLRQAAEILAEDANGAIPYLLFSIAKSLEDMSFLLANDSISVITDADVDD